MKSFAIPMASSESVAIQPSGGLESPEELAVESPHSIPHHPLGIKPSGYQYTAKNNSKAFTGNFRIFPDEVLALLLEYLDAPSLCTLGSTSKCLYAFCRSDDLWKSLFIE
jgi:hypothetical protein